MRTYVLTRSAFGPAWDRESNRRRLEVTKAVTARLMARQTITDWTWVVLLDERDPFLGERERLYRDHAPAFCPIVWCPPATHDEPRPRTTLVARQRSAAADYRAPWRDVIGAPDDTVSMTRLDDDDGFASDALERFRAAAAGLTKRTALMLPVGVRVWRNRYAVARHERNAMHTLVVPPGDPMCIYDYSHQKVNTAAPVVIVDEAPAWLWVRHEDTISGAKQQRIGMYEQRALAPITPAIRALFPVDWAALGAAWGRRR